MKSRSLISILVLFLAMLACNLPSGIATPTATTIPPTQTLITETPSLTPSPTATSFPTLTPTPLVPIAWPSDKSVNCRFGPGTEWVTIGALLVGQTATIQGMNENSSWWYVVTPNDPGSPCWVAASVTVTAGNLTSLPVIPTPNASVMGVSLNIVPKTITVAGCVGPIQPISFEGTIEVNGPVKVNWHFETQQGGAMPDQTTNLDGADSKSVSANYTPVLTAGSYWVRLIIDSPGDEEAEATYKIECP